MQVIVGVADTQHAGVSCGREKGKAAYRLHVITIFSFCFLEGITNFVDTTTTRQNPNAELNLFFLKKKTGRRAATNLIK